MGRLVLFLEDYNLDRYCPTPQSPHTHTMTIRQNWNNFAIPFGFVYIWGNIGEYWLIYINQWSVVIMLQTHYLHVPCIHWRTNVRTTRTACNQYTTRFKLFANVWSVSTQSDNGRVEECSPNTQTNTLYPCCYLCKYLRTKEQYNDSVFCLHHGICFTLQSST